MYVIDYGLHILRGSSESWAEADASPSWFRGLHDNC